MKWAYQWDFRKKVGPILSEFSASPQGGGSADRQVSMPFNR